jgi:hypothetical protein
MKRKERIKQQQTKDKASSPHRHTLASNKDKIRTVSVLKEEKTF